MAGDFELICSECADFIGWLTDSKVLDGIVLCTECYKTKEADGSL